MRWCLAVLAVSFGAGCAAPAARFRAVDAPQSDQIAPPRQQALWELVKQDCGSCHGLRLKGGLGKPLLRERMEPWPRQALATLILDGVHGTAMPRWRGLVSDDEALWIAAGLQQGAFE